MIHNSQSKYKDRGTASTNQWQGTQFRQSNVRVASGSWRSVNLHTHFHLVPKLIMHGVNFHSPLHVYLLCYVCIAVFTLDAGLLARSQYSEGSATGHLDTGFSWFPCVYKQMLKWFPRFQVATTCLSFSPPNLNLLVTNFIFCIHVK